MIELQGRLFLERVIGMDPNFSSWDGKPQRPKKS
jgi:hypothetical protein